MRGTDEHPDTPRPTHPPTAKRLLGAVFLGVAAIFVPKTEPDQHWSEPPVVQILVEYEQAGDPADDADGEPDGLYRVTLPPRP